MRYIHRDKHELVGCVYAIVHRASGKKYVGSTVNLKVRWYTHRVELKKNRHHSPKLQFAWNKYGSKAFDFVLIETVTGDLEALLEREQLYMDANPLKYNCSPSASSPLGIKRSDETKARLSASLRAPGMKEKLGGHGKGKHRPPEVVQKISRAHKERGTIPPGTLGRKRPPHECEAIRLSRLGTTASAETREKMSKSIREAKARYKAERIAAQQGLLF